jgi:hypothetical protein
MDIYSYMARNNPDYTRINGDKRPTPVSERSRSPGETRLYGEVINRERTPELLNKHAYMARNNPDYTRIHGDKRPTPVLERSRSPGETCLYGEVINCERTPEFLQ